MNATAKKAPLKAPVKPAAKPVAKQPAKSAAKADAKPKVTIGSIARAAIMEGHDNARVIAEVKKKFPDSRIGDPSVNWYRSELRGEGKDVKSSRKPPAAKLPAAKVASGKHTDKLPSVEAAKKRAAEAPGSKKFPKATPKPAPKPAAKEEGEGGFD